MWSTVDLYIWFHNLLDLGSMMMTFKIVINMTTRQWLFKYHLHYYLGSELWSYFWIPTIPGFSYSHNISVSEFNFFLISFAPQSLKSCYFQFFPLHYCLYPYFCISFLPHLYFHNFFMILVFFLSPGLSFFPLMFPLLLSFSVILSCKFPILCFILVVHL